MRALTRLKNLVRRTLRATALPVYYDASYRLPFASIEAQTGIEPRRADLALGFLTDRGFVRDADVRRPERIRYQDLALVHSAELLESLHNAESLANIFAVDPSDIVVDELLNTLRAACGGTLEAARAALSRGGPALNLLGGFHHAGPHRAAAFCALNDMAVAIRALRASGFSKRAVVLDLDAHPPDGTLECFSGDSSVWIGSISGSNWGALPGVDETVLAPGSGDEIYLKALHALLKRMPPAGLYLVVAGGDVLAGDRFGALGLSLAGARRRDLMVSDAIGERPSVWLPGGGYTANAWKVLAGTGMVLTLGSLEPIPDDYDSLREHYAAISEKLAAEELEGEFGITNQDLMVALGQGGSALSRFLDYYTAEGLEYALFRYGILQQLRRLGYGKFRIVLDRDGPGDRMRVFASADGREHLLIECLLEKREVAGERVLYVHWLTLRNPKGRFSAQRPRLPGQEEPGLGLAREAGELLGRTAARLGLAGVAFRPAWYHTAFAGARANMRFVDPARQGRFEALRRDTADRSLLEVTLALSQGRVRMNGEPYAWEPDEMVFWLGERDVDEAAVAAERDRLHFSIDARPSLKPAEPP